MREFFKEDIQQQKLIDEIYETEPVKVMDKAYKKIAKDAKKVEKDTKEVLKKDKARDKMVEKGKKAMKGKC